MHTHRLVCDDGIIEIARSDEDFDREWLRRQRLASTGPIVTYGGYYPHSRGSAPITPAEIRYAGYAFEDTTGCPICREGR